MSEIRREETAERIVLRMVEAIRDGNAPQRVEAVREAMEWLDGVDRDRPTRGECEDATNAYELAALTMIGLYRRSRTLWSRYTAGAAIAFTDDYIAVWEAHETIARSLLMPEDR